MELGVDKGEERMICWVWDGGIGRSWMISKVHLGKDSMGLQALDFLVVGQV